MLKLKAILRSIRRKEEEYMNISRYNTNEEHKQKILQQKKIIIDERNRKNVRKKILKALINI